MSDEQTAELLATLKRIADSLEVLFGRIAADVKAGAENEPAEKLKRKRVNAYLTISASASRYLRTLADSVGEKRAVKRVARAVAETFMSREDVWGDRVTPQETAALVSQANAFNPREFDWSLICGLGPKTASDFDAIKARMTLAAPATKRRQK